jgi:hypothetical protein
VIEAPTVSVSHVLSTPWTLFVIYLYKAELRCYLVLVAAEEDSEEGEPLSIMLVSSPLVNARLCCERDLRVGGGVVLLEFE